MAEISIHPLEEQPAYADLADSIIWNEGKPDGLRALTTRRGLGCLAIVGADEALTDIILITDDRPFEDPLRVPKNRTDVESWDEAYTYNADRGKGMGVLGASSPAALVRKHSREAIAAVRRVPLPRGVEQLYVGKGRNTAASRRFRWLKHGFEYAGVLARDKWYARSHDDNAMPGTDRAFARKSRMYGEAVCALLPISPSWFTDQRDNGVRYEGVPPTHVLDIGANQNGQLQKVGSCKVPVPKRSGRHRRPQ